MCKRLVVRILGDYFSGTEKREVPIIPRGGFPHSISTNFQDELMDF